MFLMRKMRRRFYFSACVCVLLCLLLLKIRYLHYHYDDAEEKGTEKSRERGSAKVEEHFLLIHDIPKSQKHEKIEIFTNSTHSDLKEKEKEKKMEEYTDPASHGFKLISVEKLISNANEHMKNKKFQDFYFQKIAKNSLLAFPEKYFGSKNVNKKDENRNENNDENKDKIDIMKGKIRKLEYEYENKIESEIGNKNIDGNGSGSEKEVAKEVESRTPSLLCVSFSSLTEKTIPDILKKIFEFNTRKNGNGSNNNNNNNNNYENENSYCDWFLVFFSGDKKLLKILQEKIREIEIENNLSAYVEEENKEDENENENIFGNKNENIDENLNTNKNENKINDMDRNRYKGKVTKIVFFSRKLLKEMSLESHQKYFEIANKIEIFEKSDFSSYEETGKNNIISTNFNNTEMESKSVDFDIDTMKGNEINNLIISKLFLLLPLIQKEKKTKNSENINENNNTKNEVFNLFSYSSIWLIDDDIDITNFNLTQYLRVRSIAKFEKPFTPSFSSLFPFSPFFSYVSGIKSKSLNTIDHNSVTDSVTDSGSVDESKSNIGSGSSGSVSGSRSNSGSDSISVSNGGSGRNRESDSDSNSDSRNVVLVSQPLISENTQSYPFLNYNHWKKLEKKRTKNKIKLKTIKPNSDVSKNIRNFEKNKIIASESNFIEIQTPFFEINFFIWFTDFLIIPLLSVSEIMGTDWGLDSLFCEAAKYYRKEQIKYFEKSFSYSFDMNSSGKNEINNKNDISNNNRSNNNINKNYNNKNYNEDVVCAVIIDNTPIHHKNEKKLNEKLGMKNKKLLNSAMIKIIKETFPFFYSDGHKKSVSTDLKVAYG